MDSYFVKPAILEEIEGRLMEDLKSSSLNLKECIGEHVESEQITDFRATNCPIRSACVLVSAKETRGGKEIIHLEEYHLRVARYMVSHGFHRLDSPTHPINHCGLAVLGDSCNFIVIIVSSRFS